MTVFVAKYKWLLRRILVIVICTVVVFRTILHYNKSYTTNTISVKHILPFRSLFLCLSNNTRQSVPPYITCEQCNLSLQESDGWFCEFDDEWLRRKRLHHIQDQKNRVSDERTLFFLNNWEPTVHCEFQRRFGMGDGGKWICDIHKLKISNSKPPLIYSFGSNGDFDFEKAIKEELPESEIHTFDQKLFICPDDVCIFHQIYLGDGGSDGSKSLQMIINDLNHGERDIDILKVDIEGSEFGLFRELFNHKKPIFNTQQNSNLENVPYIRQILFEIHLKPNSSEEESRYAHTLFETFRHNNYAIFHKEANFYSFRNVFEYAVIRLNPQFFI